MNHSIGGRHLIHWKRRVALLSSVAVLLSFIAGNVFAQGRGGRGGAAQAPQTAKAAAPIDLTGYWVALVTEDWRYRELVAPKGDFVGVPLNPEGRKVANEWDPAKDEASGEQCKGYGAPGLMRLPTRLHITWQDDQTLKVEADAGTETRLFYFGTPAGSGGDWQGISQASWEFLPSEIVSTDGARASQGRADRTAGSLKVVTTKLKAGYLRKNGIPYSANATLTEYFDLATEPNGDVHLVDTLVVEDLVYLGQPYLMSAHFKKQADASGWNPTPCSTH